MKLTKTQINRINQFLKNNNIMNPRNQIIKVLDIWKNEDGFYCIETIEKNETSEIFAELHRSNKNILGVF